MLEKRLVRRSPATPPRCFPALPLSLRPPRARDGHYSDSLLSGDAERPAKTPAGASSSSISRRRLYFASRSPRQAEPVLIQPALTAAARAGVHSAEVSPERGEAAV